MATSLIKRTLLEVYDWWEKFSPQEQYYIEQIFEDRSADAFVTHLLMELMNQEVQIGHYQFGLRESLEVAKAHRNLLSLDELRSNFYKVVHHVED